MKKLPAICAAAGLILALGGTADAVTYGLKSQDYYGSKGQFSGAPTHLFEFFEDGSGYTDLGAVKVSGSNIDADALAWSWAKGLLGFQLTEADDSQNVARDSRLISINRQTGVATVIGSWLTGRDIRGASCDTADRLWVVDARNSQLLRIDPTTGALVGSPVGFTLGGSPHVLTYSCQDLAVRRDGTFYLIDFDLSADPSVTPHKARIYTLDEQTGALTLVHTDAGQQLVGAAFSLAAEDEDLFAFEVGGSDDVFRYDVGSSFSRTTLYGNVIGSFNAGRGDLAGLIIPEPLTMLGMFLGLGSVGAYIRRRRMR